MKEENDTVLAPFHFEGHEVRALTGADGEPWFIARDVAEVLGYSNINDAIKRHCRGVVKHDLPSQSGLQSYSIIAERDVYRLILRSKLPAAERFEEWVVGTVLPTIRRTGSYGTPQVDSEQLYRMVAQAVREAIREAIANELPKLIRELFRPLMEQALIETIGRAFPGSRPQTMPRPGFRRLREFLEAKGVADLTGAQKSTLSRHHIRPYCEQHGYVIEDVSTRTYSRGLAFPEHALENWWSEKGRLVVEAMVNRNRVTTAGPLLRPVQ